MSVFEYVYMSAVLANTRRECWILSTGVASSCEQPSVSAENRMVLCKNSTQY